MSFWIALPSRPVDPDANWSFPKPWKGSVWGYKVHTLLCRWSQLPIMFLVTPANRHDSPVTMALLALAVLCFGFSITLVRADAAYFTTALMWFIRSVLNASFVIDYNLRRKSKRFLATLFFIDQWRFHLRPRATIERHFAWAKRYFGLRSATGWGWWPLISTPPWFTPPCSRSLSLLIVTNALS